MKRVIGVVSGKGGVGKTSFVANIGLSLEEFGKENLVIDADLFTSNLGMHLGLYQAPLGLHDVLDGNVDITDAVHTHDSGLKIIPASISLDYLHKKPSPYRLKSLLKNLEGFIFIDAPPGLGREVFFVLKACDEVIVVTNPDIPSVTDALKVIKVVKELKKKSIGIILNRVRRSYELRAKEVELMCGIPVIGEIPEDKMMSRSLFAKTPIVNYKPYSHASIAFKKIAANLIGVEYKPPRFLKLRRIFKK